MRDGSPTERALLARLTDGVTGFLSPLEALYLMRLAAGGPGSGVIVEIGSFHGKSTVVLAHASRAAGREKVIAIDPSNGGAIDAFHRNLARAEVAGHVTPIVATSDDAVAGWRDSIRLLWIDGAHSYEQVGRDFHNWAPFVVDGGVVAFHDSYEWDGVRRVIDEQVAASSDYGLIGVVDSIAAFRKVGNPTLVDRLRKACLGFGRRHYWRRTVRGDTRRALKHALRRISTAR